jgi:GPI mannosyltransferase 2
MLIFIIMFSKIEWISELYIHRILYSQDNNAKPNEWIEKIKQIFVIKNLLKLIKIVFCLIITLASLVASFSLYQFYLYWKLCLKKIDLSMIPIELKEYGKNNSYSMSEFNWCDKFMPFSYTDVQSKYWNVGFLKYWQLRQIPNFILATPVLLISIFAIKSSTKSIKKNYLMIIFGLKDGRMKKFDEAFNPLFGEYQHHLFVFTVHLTILTISASFFMHVQVSFIFEE